MSKRFIVSLAAAAGLVTLSGCNDTTLVQGAGRPPIAVIHSASSAYGPLDTAHFDGSASYDPDGSPIVSYVWSITARPDGSVATPSSTTADDSQVDFFVDLAGDYTIQLTVKNGAGLTGSTTFDFSAVPSQDLHIQLTWDQYGPSGDDIDLHLVDSSAVAGGGTSQPYGLWDPMFDCHYTNCKPTEGGYLDWGAPGVTSDNPRLDIDNITDYVPENDNIDHPADGDYRVMVHFYGDHGGGPTTCTLKVYLNGTVAYSGTQLLSSVNQVWNVATIHWAGGAGSVTAAGGVFTTSGF